MVADIKKFRPNGPSRHSTRWRRAAVTTSVVLAMSIAGMGLLPLGLNASGYPLRQLNDALHSHGLTAKATMCKGGVLTPVQFHGVSIQDLSGHVFCTASVLVTDESLLGRMTSGTNTRRLVLVDPILDLSLNDENELPFLSKKDVSDENLEFDIQNGSLSIRVAWRELPIVELNDLDIHGAIQQDDSGRWLTVDAITLFENERLSAKHTEQNLALIAPVLSQSTGLEGTVSAQLDPIRVQLNGDNDFIPVLSGSAQIHSLHAELKPAWSRAIITAMGRMQTTPVSDRLRLVSDATMSFGLTEAGIEHSGLTLLLPDVGTGLQVGSSGVVGLDEQLNLNLDIQVPVLANSGSPVLQALSRMIAAPFRLRVLGTVSNPQIVTLDGRPLLDEVAHRADPEGFTEQPGSVDGAVGRLIQATQSGHSDDVRRQLPGRVFGLIRSIRAAKAGDSID